MPFLDFGSDVVWYIVLFFLFIIIFFTYQCIHVYNNNSIIMFAGVFERHTLRVE